MTFKMEASGYDYMGFAWFGTTIDGKYVAYHALDANHAMRMHQQIVKPIKLV